MKKSNRWPHGRVNLALPPLTDDVKGRYACALHQMTFDATVGEEICAVFFEEPDFVDQYRNIQPFNLLSHSGLVRTDYGVVAFIVWQIAAKSPQEVLVEQFLNPQNIGAIRLVSSAANQTHFKLLVVNNRTGEVAAFVDFENVFEFDRLASAMALAIGHEPVGNFENATRHVIESIPVQQLVLQSTLGLKNALDTG